MNKVVFDIETRNLFQDVGRNDPTLLDISVVGVYESNTDTYTAYLQEEFTELWKVIERADMLIGFNSNHFDLPLLNKYYAGDLAKIKHVDLLEKIRESLGRRIGLANVAEATLNEGKSANGLEAVEWWKKGEIEKIKKYCLQDVKVTKDVYDFALKNGGLKYKDGQEVKIIKLNTSDWEAPVDSGMTYTLPF